MKINISVFGILLVGNSKEAEKTVQALHTLSGKTHKQHYLI